MRRGLPSYARVKHWVTTQVANGSLKAGERVQSESELSDRFALSRMTVNRALRELAAEGIIVRVAGVGSFVAEQRVHAHPLKVRNIAEEIRERGHEYSARVVKLQRARADARLAAQLAVRVGDRLDHSLIVHCENGIPLQLEDRFVNPDVIAGYRRNDFTRFTPHEFLMRAAPLQRAEHIVRAMQPNAAIQRLLQISSHEACLLVIRRTYALNRIATVAELFHPGSRYELSGEFAGD